MRNFSPPDEQRLQAAVGWLGLGNWKEANEELECITPEFRAHPDVLKARVKIYVAAEKWDEVILLGDALADLVPDSSFGPLHSACARRQLSRFVDARNHLLSVVERFRNDWRIHYTLARLSCKLGEREVAMQWLEKAIDLAGVLDIRLQALEDPDLETIWCDISTI